MLAKGKNKQTNKVLILVYIVNISQKVPDPLYWDCNFQIICDAINSTILLSAELNIGHLDTTFASIDPKIMKLHFIRGTYRGIWKLCYIQ